MTEEFREEYRPPTAGELTAKELMKYEKQIKDRLKEEGIPFEQTSRVYDVCNSCAIYHKNLTASVREDIFGLTGKKPGTCSGIKIRPSLDKKNKLKFYSIGECKGYFNLERIKENSDR